MNSTAFSDALEARRQKIKLFYLLYIAGCIAAAIIFFIVQQFIGAMLALIGISAYFLFVRPAMKKLKKDFSHSNVLVGLSSMLDNVTHEPKAGIQPDVLAQSKLVPLTLKKGFISREYCTGTRGGYRVQAADVSSNFMSHQAGKDRPVWISGAWTHVSLPGNSGLNLRIMHKGIMNEGFSRKYYQYTQNLFEIKTGNEAMDSAFCVYSATEGPIPSHLIRLVNELQEYTPGQVALSLIGNDLNLLITSRFISFGNLALGQAITSKLMEFVPFPEMRHILEIARVCSPRD